MPRREKPATIRQSVSLSLLYPPSASVVCLNAASATPSFSRAQQCSATSLIEVSVYHFRCSWKQGPVPAASARLLLLIRRDGLETTIVW
jgi:hypothetical protein